MFRVEVATVTSWPCPEVDDIRFGPEPGRLPVVEAVGTDDEVDSDGEGRRP